jgi:hypothetical protein
MKEGILKRGVVITRLFTRFEKLEGFGKIFVKIW